MILDTVTFYAWCYKWDTEEEPLITKCISCTIKYWLLLNALRVHYSWQYQEKRVRMVVHCHWHYPPGTVMFCFGPRGRHRHKTGTRGASTGAYRWVIWGGDNNEFPEESVVTYPITGEITQELNSTWDAGETLLLESKKRVWWWLKIRLFKSLIADELDERQVWRSAGARGVCRQTHTEQRAEETQQLLGLYCFNMEWNIN